MAPIVDRVKWLEPFGQALIIAAIGLQLYFIDPAASMVELGRRMKATPADCQPKQIINHQTNAVTTIPDLLCVQRMLPDALITAGETQKRTFKWWYALLYIIGGISAVVGKCASVKASIK